MWNESRRSLFIVPFGSKPQRFEPNDYTIPIECGKEITVANNMVVGVNGLIATGLIIAENMVI